MSGQARAAVATLSTALISLIALSASSGCGTTEEGKRLTITEIARRVADLRDEADECYARFQKSQETSVEELECFMEKQRETTELYDAPSDCPDCYLNYARGLMFLGNFHRKQRDDAKQALARAPESERARLEARARESDQRARQYFRRSTEIFQIYFDAPKSGMWTDAYGWVSAQHAELGDYESAIRYLDMFVKAVKPGPTAKAELDRLRNEYQRRLDREEAEALRKSGDA